ncbi:MAG TPA: hypothetical protein VMW62_05960 [Chloroflexota bacterium]|nr:hypothetical protein [Chloroflexota bacterium]
MARRKAGEAEFDLGLPPLFSQPPGEAERELRLVAQHAARHWPADALALTAPCRQCRVERELWAWLPGLQDERRRLAVGQTLLRPAPPLATRPEELDVVDGIIQGSAFCSVCFARLLVR